MNVPWIILASVNVAVGVSAVVSIWLLPFIGNIEANWYLPPTDKKDINSFRNYAIKKHTIICTKTR